MKKRSAKTCEYETCDFPINQHHDKQFCIYHAPKENKGISVEEFNELIYKEKIGKNDFNFKGYIFPGNIDFPKVKIKELKDACFARVPLKLCERERKYLF